MDSKNQLVGSHVGSQSIGVGSGAASGKPSLSHSPLSTVRYPAAIYLLFMLAVYWPVFLGRRFFWEDFFCQEYPVREFCFYMVRWAHALPFWNPYSWAWSPLLADAQSGFWYPTNLLQIAITWLFNPTSAHLPVLVPETMTLLHMPLAALGMFVLARKEFRLGGLTALISGFCWGFGLQMAAEQNHPMFVLQLALLPWETLLLMRAWNSWRAALWLGLLLGTSFFAGQPQAFFYISIFLGAFTLAESFRRWHHRRELAAAARPVILASVAMAIAVGVSAIQLLPTSELVNLSSRQHLSYSEASGGQLQPYRVINAFVPKFFGEDPGFASPRNPGKRHPYYWEATFYWGEIAEILALFGLITHWKLRRRDDAQSRYITFFALFSVLCLAYAVGSSLYFQWLFWRFVPFFSHIRAPNRMVWFVWYIGAILTGIGLETLLVKREHIRNYRGLFLWSSGLFLLLNLLAISGVFDTLYQALVLGQPIRYGIWRLLGPGLLVSIFSFLFFLFVVGAKLNPRIVLLCASLLIAGDLYYNDFTWFRNSLDPETTVAQDSTSAIIEQFRGEHGSDHAKLLLIEPNSELEMQANLGMFLRLPIEYANEDHDVLAINPLRLEHIFPPVQDSARQFAMMGVVQSIGSDTMRTSYPNYLPFLKLYRQWEIDTGARANEILNDSSFDYSRRVLLDRAPPAASLSNAISYPAVIDTAILETYSENHLKIVVHASRASVLVVNDLYYPAWQATVDGRNTEILRAFTTLRAIPVAAGIHVVTLDYNSSSFNLGWKVTVGTVLLVFLVLILGRREKIDT